MMSVLILSVSHANVIKRRIIVDGSNVNNKVGIIGSDITMAVRVSRLKGASHIRNEGLRENFPRKIITNKVSPITDCAIGCEMFESVTSIFRPNCNNGVIINVCNHPIENGGHH